MKDNSPQQEIESDDFLQDLIKRWDLQHNAPERYIFAWFLPFWLFRKLRIEPTSRKGTRLRFLFIITMLLLPPLITTSLKNEWDISPVWIWVLIAFVYSFVSLTYPLYKNAGHNMCSLGFTVVKKADVINQIKWDHNWFAIRWSSIPGIITSLALMVVMIYMQSTIAGATIATGTYFMLAVLGYQIGESTWVFLLICVEVYRISLMKHKLYGLRPTDTISLQQSLQGYNQLAALNSLFMTAFLGGLALLLPEQQYLANPILLAYLIITYIVIGLTIFVPRISIQRVVRASKIQEMKLIQDLLVPLYGRIQALSTIEFEQLKRLDEVHEIVKSSYENFLPFSTIGRVIGNIFLPTLTFFLAVVSETYLQMILEKFFR